MELPTPPIACFIVEFDGDTEWGTHEFTVLPRRGDVIELWLDPENELIAKVEEVRHMEVDPETRVSDIKLFVTRL
jgi:hypothetical protein